MASLPPPPPLLSTERQTGGSEPLLSLCDDAIAAPPGAAFLGSYASSPPLAPAYDAVRGSSLLVPPRTDSNRGIVGGCLGSEAPAGIARRRANSCGRGVGDGAVRDRWTSRSPSHVVHQQGLYPPRRWRARSAARSTAALRSPGPFSSSAAATITFGPVALQGTTAGPFGPTAVPRDRLGAPPPGGMAAEPHQVSAHPTQAVWDGVVGGSTAANLGEVTSCERSGTFFLGRHSSSPADPRAPADASRSSCPIFSGTLSTRRVPLQWSSASASAPPPMGSSPATHEHRHRHCITGAVDGCSHPHLGPQRRFAWADPAALSGVTECAAPLPHESAIPLSASCRTAHSTLRVGSSPPIVSGTSVAARTEASDVAHAYWHNQFSRDASVATLRGSDHDVKAPAAGYSDIHTGRRMQQQQCFHQEGEGAATVDTSAFADRHDESSRADDDYTAHQSRASMAADSLSHKSSTQPPPPSSSSSSLADSAMRLNNEDMGRSTHHGRLFCHDDSAAPPRNPGGGDGDGAENLSVIFLTGEGGVAPELVRAERDVRLPFCCSVAVHNAEASPADTVHKAHVEQSLLAGACSGAVLASDAQAPLGGVPFDATLQSKGKGMCTPSHTSSIAILSQELPRRSPPPPPPSSSSSSSSLATDVGGSCPRYRPPRGIPLVPSRSLEDLCAMAPDTTEPSRMPPFAQGTRVDLPHSCPHTLANSLDTGRTSATTPPLRLPTSTSSSALPPRSASVATQQPSTTPPVNEHGRDEGDEGALEDAATGSTEGSATHWLHTAPSLSPTSPAVSSASQSLAAVARLRGDQDHHGAVGEVRCAITAHPPPRAPVTASSLAKAAHAAAPALPSWRAERQGQHLTPPVGAGSEPAGVGMLPAATWAMQGCSPRTPRGQRESPLVSQVRVALIDARSVRSHLDELRTLFPKNSAAAAGGNAVQSIHRGVAGNSELVAATGPDPSTAAAISTASDMRDGPHPGESGGVRAGAWETPTQGMGDTVDGAVDCRAAVGASRSSVLQRAQRGRGAHGGAEDHHDRVIRRDFGGGHDSSRDCANVAREDAPPQRSPQDASQEVGDSDSDGHSGRSPAPTFDVGDLYTSSLNKYRHQRLTRLTQQHLQSLFIGVSGVAKLVCGIEVEQCAQMGVAEGLGWVDDHVPGGLCEEAVTLATPPVATTQSPFFSAVVAAVPTPRVPREPRDGPISAPSEGAATVQRVSRDAPEASRQPEASPSASIHSHLSGVVQELAAEHHAPLGCHEQPPVTEGRGTSPSSCRSDSPSRCVDVAASLSSGSVVGGDRSTRAPCARPRALASTADKVTVGGVESEDVATVDFPSSAVVSPLGAAQAVASANTNANANAVAASYCYSGHHHSEGRGAESPGSSPSSMGSSVSASGTIYIHPITQGSTSSVTTLSSGLNDMGGSSGGGGGGNRMRYYTTSSSSSARGGGGGYIPCAARGVLGSASKSMAPATEPTSGRGPFMCTRPMTGLVHVQQHEQPLISVLHSAPLPSAACTTPPSWCDSPPVAWVGRHSPLRRAPLASSCGVFPSTLPTPGICCRSPSSANSATSETNGTAASVDHSSGFPPAGETAVLTGTRASPPPPPPPPPPILSLVVSPQPASIHGGIAAASVCNMPGVPALPLAVERVLSSVGKGASDSAHTITPALDERCAPSVDEIVEKSFASPCSSAWVTSSLLTTPTLPSAMRQVGIHDRKEKGEGGEVVVVVEGMAGDAYTAPSLVFRADISDTQRTAVAAAGATAPVATMLGTSRAEAHDGGTAHMLLLTPSSFMATRQEKVREARVEEHSGSGPAAMDMVTGAVASDALPRAAGAVAEVPRTVVAAGDIPVGGDASAASLLHESTEPIACDIRGGSNPSESQSTTMPMSIRVPPSHGPLSLNSSPMLRSAAAHVAETATCFVSLTTDGCNGSAEEIFTAFPLLHRTTTTTTTTPPSAHGPEDVSADTATTVSRHPSLSGSVSDIGSGSTATMSIMLSSSSASRRRPPPPPPPPPLSKQHTEQQHTLRSCAPAADSCDTSFHAAEPHVHVATGAQGGDEASGGPSLIIEGSSGTSPQGYAKQGELPVPSTLATSQLLFGTTPASSLSSSSSSSSAPCDGVSSKLDTCTSNGGAGDAVGAYHGLLWDVLAERTCDSVVAAELRDVASAPQESPSGCESIVSLQTPQEPRADRDAPSVVAHPHLMCANTSSSTPLSSSSSSSSSLCKILLWSTDGTRSIVVAAVPVEEACGPRSCVCEDLTSTVRAEQQSLCGGDDASARPPLPNTTFLPPDMCSHEGVPSRMKRDDDGNSSPQQNRCTLDNRSSSSNSNSGGGGGGGGSSVVADNVLQPPLRGPLVQGNEEQHPSLYAVSPSAPSYPSSMTALHLPHCSGGFEAQRGPGEDGNTMDTLASGKEQPSPCSDAVLTICGLRLPSSSPTMAVLAPPGMVRSAPEGGERGCEADAFVMTLGDVGGVADVPRPLDFTPTQLIHSTQGEMHASSRTDSIPVVPDGERDGAWATAVQPSCTARASACVNMCIGPGADTVRGDGPRRNDAVVDYATSDEEDMFAVFSSFTSAIAHNVPHAHDGVLAQRPRCHQDPSTQACSSILSLSGVGSAATAGSPRTTTTDLMPSAAMPAPGQQRRSSCWTAEIFPPSTAPGLLVEILPGVVDGICRAQGGSSDSVGAHPVVVATSTTAAAGAAAAAAALCRIAMCASTTAAVGSSLLPQNRMVKLCATSLPAAWLATPHVVSGTTACSSASHLLNREGESSSSGGSSSSSSSSTGSSGGGVADGVVTIEMPSTSPRGKEKECVFSLWGSSSAPSHELCRFSFSTTAAATASDGVGGAVCHMCFGAPGLGTASNTLSTFSTSTEALLRRLQRSAAVLRPICYSSLIAEASSPLQRSASTSVASSTLTASAPCEAASVEEVRAREEGRVETPIPASSEDVTALLSTPWHPATQLFPERPAGSSAIVVGPVTLPLGWDGGRTGLADKSGLGTASAVVEAGRPVSAGSLLQEGVAQHLSCGYSGDAVDGTVRDKVADISFAGVGDSSVVRQRTSSVSVTSPTALAAHRADAPEGGSTDAAVMSGRQGEVSRHEPVFAFSDAGAAADAAPPTWPSSSSWVFPSAGLQTDGVVCLHDAGAQVMQSASLLPGPAGPTEAEVITSHRSAEAVGGAAAAAVAQKSEKRHIAAPTAASNAKRSAGALDTLGACPMAPGQSASTPKLGPASAPGSEGLKPRVSPEVASSMRAPAQIFCTAPPEPRHSPPSLSPNTHFSAPSYYLAQCEDGLADVYGSLHGWHTTASAFFAEAEATAVSCRAHQRVGGLSSGASTRYTSVSTLARRRAQQRVFYDSAGLRGASPPAFREHTVMRSLSPVSLAPLRTAGVFAHHSEKSFIPSASLSTAAAGALHNDRLFTWMRQAVQLTNDDSDGGP